MKTRVLFLLSLYLVITLTLSAFPQMSLAGDGSTDPPINDTIPDTTITSIPSFPEGNTEINYWLIIKTIITIGI